MRLRIKIGLFCYVVSILWIIQSCSDSDSNKRDQNSNNETDTSSTITASSMLVEYLYASSLPRDSFFKRLQIPRIDNPNGKLVLRFNSENLWETNVVFGLTGHVAGNASALDEVPAFQLGIKKDSAIPTIGSRLYIFGNNEVNLHKMKEMVISGRDTLNFDEFIFYPAIGKKTGAVYFTIFPAKAGVRVRPYRIDKLLNEQLYSNPSPPKRPAGYRDAEAIPE